MRKLKNENGAITMLVLISVVFVLSFLMSAHILIANKVKTQKEIIAETKRIYKSDQTMEEIYNSYFNNGDIIPIYTVEQLLSIGSEQLISIQQKNGQIYRFTKDGNYMLMNDLEFSTLDWTNLIGTDEQGDFKEWIPIGKVIRDGIDGFTGSFEGNIYKIKVTDLNGDLYEYNKQNGYCRLINVDIKIKNTELFNTAGKLELAVKYSATGETKTYSKQDLIGEEDRIFTL